MSGNTLRLVPDRAGWWILFNEFVFSDPASVPRNKLANSLLRDKRRRQTDCNRGSKRAYALQLIIWTVEVVF